MMAEIQARHLPEIVAGKVQPLAVETLEKGMYGAGDLSRDANGVRSSIYGTLEFMTPIIEMDLEKVTRGEAESYQRWRDSYQQNWSNYFDPIAVRLEVSQTLMAADLTV